MSVHLCLLLFFFLQAEDGIRVLVRSRGLGDVYKRQTNSWLESCRVPAIPSATTADSRDSIAPNIAIVNACLLYTSDAADERSSVDLGGRRIIKKKKRVI